MLYGGICRWCLVRQFIFTKVVMNVYYLSIRVNKIGTTKGIIIVPIALQIRITLYTFYTASLLPLGCLFYMGKTD